MYILGVNKKALSLCTFVTSLKNFLLSNSMEFIWKPTLQKLKEDLDIAPFPTISPFSSSIIVRLDEVLNHQLDIAKLEKVQRQAASFFHNNYYDRMPVASPR